MPRAQVVLSSVLLLLWPAFTFASPAEELQQRLNDQGDVRGDDAIESWHELGAAAIGLSAMPDEVAALHLSDLRPGEPGWDAAVAWAQAHADVEAAIKTAAERRFIGLPYGVDAVPEEFQNAGFSVGLPDLETSVSPTFNWLTHLVRIDAWAQVEAWRRIEAGDGDGAVDLMVNNIKMLRKASDRGFLVEKQVAISLMLEAIVSLREMLFEHLDDLSAERLQALSKDELGKIRVDRDRLLLPEHDRFVHQALIDQAFDHSTGKVEAESFRKRFTQMQGEVSPIGFAGIDSRWRNLAEWQASLEASREQLDNLYDDWWRRWRVRSGTDLAVMILAEPPYAERLNAVRYAGILSTLGDMDRLFADRNRLITELDATCVAAGLASYRRTRGVYPVSTRMAWGIDIPRYKDVDPFSTENYTFIYFVPETDWTLDIGADEVVIPAGTGVLYSRGRDGFDNSAKRHTVDGFDGDLIIWPPPTSLDKKASTRTSQ
ncbi:MAG: hypothetical protein MK074_01200 [Phycisphaerales bacterium]|nr:hypothetical protein [Phycisphaerales bacterium]